jgi:hypothetical protein
MIDTITILLELSQLASEKYQCPSQNVFQQEACQLTHIYSELIQEI